MRIIRGLWRSYSSLIVHRQTRTHIVTTNEVITIVVGRTVDTEIPIGMEVANTVETTVITVTAIMIDAITIDATMTTADTGKATALVVVPHHKKTRSTITSCAGRG